MWPWLWLLIFLSGSQATEPANERCVPKQVYLTLGDAFADDSPTFSGKNSAFLVNFFTSDPCHDLSLEITEQSPAFNYSVQHERRSLKYDNVQFAWRNLTENVTLKGFFHFFHVSVQSVLKKGAHEIKFRYSIALQGKPLYSKLSKIPYTSEDAPVELLLFADFDDTPFGSNSWEYLKKLNRSTLSAFFFLGDVNYEFWQNNGANFGRFFDKLASLSTSVPLLMIPGNHEEIFNYSFFDQRVRLPRSSPPRTNRFSSWNLGSIHFVHVELNFFANGYLKIPENSGAVEAMMTQLEEDLIAADSELSRQMHPWIVVSTHKPLYCSSGAYCAKSATLYSRFEELFRRYNVDLIISGHIHASELVKPRYKGQVMNYSLSQIGNQYIITNARGPVQFISGNAGSFSGFEKDDLGRREERFFFDNTKTGVGRLIARNKSHLLLETIETPRASVSNAYWLTKTVLRPFLENCNMSGFRYRLVSLKGVSTMSIIIRTTDYCPDAKFVLAKKELPITQEEKTGRQLFQPQLHVISFNISSLSKNKIEYSFLGNPGDPSSTRANMVHSVPNEQFFRVLAEKKVLIFGRVNRNSFKTWASLLNQNSTQKNFSSVVVLSREGVSSLDSGAGELFSKVPSFFFDRTQHLPQGETLNTLNFGRAHIVFFDLNTFNEGSEAQKQEMIRTLEQDLKEADREEQRRERPWLIIIGPRSFYCRTTHFCGTYNSNYSSFYRLFHNHSVDMIITTEHSQTKAFVPLSSSDNYEQEYPNLIFNPLRLSHKDSSQPVHINLANNKAPLLVNQGNAFSFNYTNRSSLKTSFHRETVAALKCADKLRYDIYTKNEKGEEVLMARITLGKDSLRAKHAPTEKGFLALLLSLFIYLAVVGLHGFILVIVFIGYGKRWRWATRPRTRVTDTDSQEDSQILRAAGKTEARSTNTQGGSARSTKTEAIIARSTKTDGRSAGSKKTEGRSARSAKTEGSSEGSSAGAEGRSTKTEQSISKTEETSKI